MNWGSLHPITVHYPVVLFTLAAFLDIYSYMTDNKRTYTVAHWMIILGTLFMIPTIFTGLMASGPYSAENPYVVLHKSLAFLTFVTGFINSTLRVFWFTGTPILSNKYTVQFSVLTVLLIILTSDVGGVITHGKSPFVWANRFHEEVNYYDLNSRQARIFKPEQLKEYLSREVDVTSVSTIFERTHCIKCHQQYFENGLPLHFSKEFEGKPAWLPRDKENRLVDWENSPFYKTVIQLNRMPYDEQKIPIGLSWADRLTLLVWLQNNAPTALPPKPVEDENGEDHNEEES